MFELIKHQRRRASHLAIVTCLATLACTASSRVSHGQLPTNNDPTNQIRFSTVAQADAKRSQLINFIWSEGLPAAVPALTSNVALPSGAIEINPLNVAKVDRLDANVSGWDFHALTYLLHPTNTSNANRVVIVHHGHAHSLDAGVGATANHFLQNGFTVAVMEMPLFGWNTDKTAMIPGRGTLTYNSHNQIVNNTAINNDGQGFRPFLEPAVQTVNYIAANTLGLNDIGMVGLSGGGWTTSMMSAIDPRIKLSVPVAGSAPLYHRNTSPNSVGDAEQNYAPLFAEDIAPGGTGGGVATWLEIYALGGHGQGRRQIQVTNEFDSCCFSGTFANSYKAIVTDKVNSLGGKWSHELDSTHHSHQISPHTIANVIDPLFGIANPAPTPTGLPILDEFNNQTNELPAGWIADPNNVAGATAVENAGRVTIRGSGLSSIVRSVPFNPQLGQPITITMQLASMSADCFGGVFITDQTGTRPHHLGVLLNASTKQIAVNADNGGGFSGTGDRVILGTLPGYSGGAVTLKLVFETNGFSVSIDAGAGGTFNSGNRPWSQVPNGFDPANLGDHVLLFMQSSDLNGGAAASMSVDSVAVQGSFMVGDFDSDGDVDGADFVAWQTHFPTASGATLATGDADGDGDVDGADFIAWQSHFPTVTSGGAPTVPEPPFGVLAIGGLAGWAVANAAARSSNQ